MVGGRREIDGRETVRLIEQAGGEAVFIPSDVTIERDVSALVGGALDAFGRLDCAFNNAGYLGQIAPVTRVSLDEYERTMATNVRGMLLCLRHELRVMLEAGTGAIVNNASLAGLVGSPDNAVYDASKHAVVGLTRSAALEVARSGVRINAICASSVETAMDEHFRAGKGLSRDQLAEAMPMGRLCSPAEVAPAVVFLCSEGASYITGATLAIDGGFSAR